MTTTPFSYANLSNLPLIEELYQRYTQDPQSVDSSWRAFFEGMQLGEQKGGMQPASGSADLRIYLLIYAYRSFGHLMASYNPIAMHPPKEPRELSLEALGFKTEELSVSFPTCGFLKEPQAKLSDLIDALKKTYCRTIGIEYIGMGEKSLEEWIQKRIEPFFDLQLSKEEKLRVMHYLSKAEIFESFIHTKYVGQKRFSLEGGETLIPMLAAMIDTGAEEGVVEVVLGMAHRGRLNVLANILNKSYAQIFHEFEDHYSPELSEGTGDVKYHKGFTGELKTQGGKNIAIALAANPSHLEAVGPIVEGQVRAKQEMKGDQLQRKEVIPILVHGDAAIAGQGVVYETMQLSRLTGYSTGGTVHIVVNNQIGFTTLPKDARSTRYCTDIARSFGSPVFHVNAEDPEGCVAVAKLAMQIRQNFQCDVFIDLGCYRKYGHNEGDEPTFTQPHEYRLIKSKQPIRQIYKEQLAQEGILDASDAELIEKEFKESLQASQESVQKPQPSESSALPAARDPFEKEETKVSKEEIIRLAELFCTPPKEITLHPKIEKLLSERLAMVHADPAKESIDWGMAEHLAYASLVVEGTHVRLSGQDSRRGTFSHRHAMWTDQASELKYFALSHLSNKQALFDVFNSPLSEFAVLGFEFGYSLFYPKSLVIWEAQYGDFGNGAQVVIDQFIASSEQKWTHKSNIALLLPHGYEGQGPEHSSARIERFLQLSGEDNMRVCNCSTPAQLFHLLRLQALRSTKKPLVLFTPKGMLRHPSFLSSLNQFTEGSFEEILDDPSPPKKANRLVFCSGKIYYELSAEREKRKKEDVAIVRIEQLYPLHFKKLEAFIAKYNGFSECFWVQEEHSNMGPWEYMRPRLEELLKGKAPLRYAGRGRSAAVATGSRLLHKQQHEAFINEVL